MLEYPIRGRTISPLFCRLGPGLGKDGVSITENKLWSWDMQSLDAVAVMHCYVCRETVCGRRKRDEGNRKRIWWYLRAWFQILLTLRCNLLFGYETFLWFYLSLNMVGLGVCGGKRDGGFQGKGVVNGEKWGEKELCTIKHFLLYLQIMCIHKHINIK